MAKLINNETPYGPYEPLVSQEHQLHPYQFYGIGLFFHHNDGKVQLGLAKEDLSRHLPQECMIVRRRAAVGALTIKFQVERKGDWPIIPDPTSHLDPNLVYAWSEVHVSVPQLTEDASNYMLAVAGVYHYYLKFPVWGPITGLYAGWNPIIGTPFYNIPASQFRPFV